MYHFGEKLVFNTGKLNWRTMIYTFILLWESYFRLMFLLLVSYCRDKCFFDSTRVWLSIKNYRCGGTWPNLLQFVFSPEPSSKCCWSRRIGSQHPVDKRFLMYTRHAVACIMWYDIVYVSENFYLKGIISLRVYMYVYVRLSVSNAEFWRLVGIMKTEFSIVQLKQNLFWEGIDPSVVKLLPHSFVCSIKAD